MFYSGQETQGVLLRIWKLTTFSIQVLREQLYRRSLCLHSRYLHMCVDGGHLRTGACLRMRLGGVCLRRFPGDNDVHKCGRCQTELSCLEAFIQHRVQNLCQRESDEAPRHATSPGTALPAEAHRAPNQHIVFVEEKDEVESVLLYMAKPAGHGNHVTAEGDAEKSVLPALFMSSDGRYICHICQKTFKTEIILKTHMSTHSKRKPFRCKICDIQFRMKGSLERHNRRHTDERPYVCKQCGLAFRESGALTRHLKSRMPCYKRPFYRQLSFWAMQGQNTQYTTGKMERMLSIVEKPADGAANAVLQVLDDSAGKDLAILQPLGLCNKMANQDQEEEEEEEEVRKPAHEVEVGQTGSTLEQLDKELTKGEVSGNDQTTSAVPETGSTHTQETSPVVGEDVSVDRIVTTAMRMEVVPGYGTQFDSAENANDVTTQGTLKPMSNGTKEAKGQHWCEHCQQNFERLSSACVHIKSHEVTKEHRCQNCNKVFNTAHLLQKHSKAHLSERRFCCGECGKLCRSLNQVKEHMRVHSDLRPHVCSICNKAFKTKNALMVHERTHREDKPYTCFECPAVFREKASLVRHSRVHTGERPFHCGKCGRGFTEHGTLNRHLRAKGGCGIGSRIAHWDKQAIRQLGCISGDGPVPESDGIDLKSPEDDPSAMLVEFSSVVASTQEYIVETTQQEALTDTACVQEVQMDSELLEVVHQIVSQVHPDSAHQIIVQSVSPSQSSLGALSACNSLSTNVHSSIPTSDEVATPGSDLIMPFKPQEVIGEAEIVGRENQAALVALHGANMAVMTDTTAEEIIVISNDCKAVERQVKESGGLTVLKTKEESGLAILAEDKASAELYVVALCSDDENAIIESQNNNEENIESKA